MEEGLAKGWESSGNNVTGGSNNISLPRFVMKLNEVMPLKRIAVVYTPGEKQSELHLAKINEGAKVLKLEPAAIPIQNAADAAALPGKLSRVDVLFVTGGTAIGSNIAAIVSAAIKGKVVTATHVGSFLESGVMLGLSAVPSEVGQMTGKSLVRVLQGEQPSAIPIRSPSPQMILNAKTAKAQGFVASAALRQWITKTIE